MLRLRDALRAARRRPFVAVGAGLVLSAGGGASAMAAGSSPPRTVRVGQRPPLASTARTVGAVVAATPMHVTIALKPRDPAALAAYASAASTPGSSAYRHYLTPAQFGQRFGATRNQLTAVEGSLRAHGLTPGAVGPNRLSIPVSGTAGQVERAFSLSFRRVALRGGRQAVVANAAPALDARIAADVEAVLGLSTVSAPRPLLVRPAAAIARSSAPPSGAGAGFARHITGHAAGPSPCPAATSTASAEHAYTEDQIASTYRFSNLYGSGAAGHGQTIAVYELEPNDPNDIAQYQACYGTSASVSYVQVDGGAGSGEGSGEAALDIENTIGLAPDANFIVYQGPNGGQVAPGSGPYDTFSAIINQDRAQVISVSWGECEQFQGSANVSAESTLFQEAATQGQSMVAATGDEGSEDCNQTNGIPDTELAVDDPGSQPFVTAAGGTTLSSLGPPPSETVWNSAGNPSGIATGGAAGGGVSRAWQMPGYQSRTAGSLHVINGNSSGSFCGNSGGWCREVPDVSADADPSTGYLIYWNGSGADPTHPAGWQAVGGTSAAAPLWAALLADVNSSQGCRGSAVGFANPALYQTADAAYARSFNDVTTGNNDVTGTNGGLYPASTAYDMASGLGTPNAAALAAELCTDALRVNNPGTQVSTLHQPVSLQITTTALPGASLTYYSSQLPPGLTISRSTGRITGRPTSIGTWSVGVAALDQSLALRGAFFTWKVVGPPRISQAALTGVGARRPRLAFTITAGRSAPAFKVISIRLPKGLSFGRHVRKVTVSGRKGRRVAFSARVAGGQLQVTLRTASSRVRISISYAAITATPGLAARTRRHRAPTLALSVRTSDSSNRTTTAGARIKPRS